MDIDAKLLKELTETFNIELNEQLQVITDGLLFLENSNAENGELLKKVDDIFRSAHNIKGAARGIGVLNVGEIAHHVESIFSAIKLNRLKISPQVIDLCLETVDAMRSAMNSHINNAPLSFNMQELIDRLKADASSVKSGDNNKNSAEKKSNDLPITSHQNLKHAQTETTIRVSLEHLDQVSALMEEIQVNKISIDEYYQELTKLNSKTQQLAHLWKQAELEIESHYDRGINGDLKKILDLLSDTLMEVISTTQQLNNNMRPTINELSTLSNNLQIEVRMLRLIPASELLRTLPRLVRDLAHELNKKVELIVKGEDVKMDKMILEGLKDPLIHILRNAVDHAIESTEVRKRIAKAETGRIAIEIIEEGNQILLTITDDGAGMNVNEILSLAKSKHLITKTALEGLSETEILDLIFLPGFSTKETITNVSGRGVGLDIVKENMAYLKGNVTVKTELGKGTTFYLRVPLTLASEQGLVLNCGGQIFAIPTSSIERVLVLSPNEIINVSASHAIILDKHTIPLRSLADILNLKKTEVHVDDKVSIIVIKKGWQTVALLVDEIIGEREMVIKPLQAPLMNISYIAGGTLSGSGQVILVLNSNDIINAALRIKKTNLITPQIAENKSQMKPHILVVDDSITTRTMEKNVLENKNYEVTLAVNGKEAWDILQKKKFSLLITDVSMPIMDGFTLTEKVKKSTELHDLPVIIVTSLESASDKKRGIDVGANAYIVKNEFESDTLLKIVEQLV